ncbi:hypothetical protein ACQ86E_20830 [Bradyrhizobium betae]|uniref:hypothetical protein n=1 Tax=Bradyrhizobium betae TaxID=244734 RepID=UPI003D6754EF
MGFRWERGTARDKIALYEIVRSLLKKKNWEWKTLWKEMKFEVGMEYERNFRRGEISTSRAVQIFKWVQDNYPETAAHLESILEDALASLDPNNPWERLIEERGEFSNLELSEVALPRYVYDGPRSKITEERSSSTPIQRTVKLYQRFSFRVESPFDGQVLGFQRTGGVWWPIPLGRTLHKKWPSISAGKSWWPYDPDDEDRSAPQFLLRASEEPGLHMIVFPILRDASDIRINASNENRVPPDVLDRLAAKLSPLPPDACRIFRMNVMVRDLDEPEERKPVPG